MTQETITILSIVLPMVGSAVGAIVATKISVARLREDVQTLYKQLHELKNNVHQSNLTHEVEHGELKVAIARMETKLETL